MKKFISAIFLTLTFIHSVSAQDLTSLDVLIRQGMAVKMGELTGAGSRFSLNHLQGLVLPEGVIMKADCDGIIVKNNKDPKISDIVRIKIQNTEIDASEFIGFVVQ